MIRVRFFELGELVRRGFLLIFFLPIAIRHAVDNFARLFVFEL